MKSKVYRLRGGEISKSISLDKFEVEDFISIDSGDRAITITKFNGKIRVGETGWSSQILLNIDQAIELVNELDRRIKILKKEVQNE